MEPGMEVDLGTLLLGVAAVIGSLAASYTAITNTRKIRAIDHAVNNRILGAQTMESQVDDLHSDRPPPPEIPEEINGVPMAQMVALLVADMYERRKKE